MGVVRDFQRKPRKRSSMYAEGLSLSDDFLERNKEIFEEKKNPITKTSLQRVFKNRNSLSKKDLRRMVYKLLKRYPCGLTIEEISFFLGLVPLRIKETIKSFKELKEPLDGGIYERKVNKYISIYYTKSNSRSVKRKVEQKDKKIQELLKKTEAMQKSHTDKT